MIIFSLFSGVAEKLFTLLERGPIDMTSRRLSEVQINALTTMRLKGFVTYQNGVFSLPKT